ncbi:hypothetical protein J6590_089085 [Homalodisca vitripennis]|nr:hypothetical protein J6590_089085 [Homalodisca vitripennis]
MSMYDFQLHVLESLLPKKDDVEAVLPQTVHTPTKLELRNGSNRTKMKTCRVCTRNGKRSQTRYVCMFEFCHISGTSLAALAAANVLTASSPVEIVLVANVSIESKGIKEREAFAEVHEAEEVPVEMTSIAMKTLKGVDAEILMKRS